MTTHLLDHADRGADKLISFFKNKAVNRAWVQSYLKQIQELENAAWEVIEKRWIENGTGVALDVIGRVVGRGRNGLGDDLYKRALRVQIRINRSQGLPEDMIDVMRLTIGAENLHGSLTLFRYYELYPAAIKIVVTGMIADPGIVIGGWINVAWDNIRQTKPAGVALTLDYNPSEFDGTFDSYAFILGSEASAPDSPINGLGDVAGTTGGGLGSTFQI